MTTDRAEADLNRRLAAQRREPTTFERERRGFSGPFEIYADRKDKPFVMLSSGLSHNGGRIQHLMSPADAKALGNALIDAAEFADHPMMSDLFTKRGA